MKKALAFLLGFLVPVMAGATQYAKCHYGEACRIPFTLFDYTDPTTPETISTVAIVTGDVYWQCTLSGTSTSDNTTIVTGDITEIVGSTYGFEIELGATETDCERIKIDIIDAAGDVWFPHTITIDTVGNASAGIEGILTSVPNNLATTDNIGINWGDVTNQTATVPLTNTTVGTVTALSGHTAQTADHTAAIANVPTVAEFNARTVVSASYFDPAVDTVANVTTVATNTDMRGTDNAILAASAPTNFGDFSITATTGRVDVGAWQGLTQSGGVDVSDAVNAIDTTIGTAGVGLTEAGGTGDQLTAINLPNQTMDITGSLSGSVGTATALGADAVTAAALATSAAQEVADTLLTIMLNCVVNTANFLGSTTTFACILTDRDGGAVTQATDDLTGRRACVTSGVQIRECRYVIDTTWDGVNSELQMQIDRALPATLADAVTVELR